MLKIKRLLVEFYRFLYFVFTWGGIKYEWRLDYWADELEKKDCDYINNCFIRR